MFNTDYENDVNLKAIRKEAKLYVSARSNYLSDNADECCNLNNKTSEGHTLRGFMYC